MLQALASALGALFQDDCFISLLNHVANEQLKDKLVTFSQAFLDAIDTDEAKTWLTKSPIGKRLADAYDGAIKFHKLVCVLLEVETSSSVSEQDILVFERYHGPCTFRRAVKSLMTSPEPESSSKSEIKAQSRDLLRKLKIDALRTAATSGPAQEKMKVFISQLDSCDRTLAPGCCTILANVLQEMDMLANKTRPGATKPLKDAAVRFTKEIATKATGER